MRFRVFRPSIAVQPTPDELDRFSQNVVSYADLGKVFAIEVLVEGVCRTSNEFDGRIGSTPISRHLPFRRKRSHGWSDSADVVPRSALSLVYDEQYHRIFMKHNDVTMGVTSRLEGNQVAKLMRSLVVLYNEVRSAAVEWDIGSRRDTLQTSLRVFNEALEALKPLTPTGDQKEFDAYRTLYRNLEHMSEQVVSGRTLEIDFTEDDVRLLPSTLHTTGELLRFLDNRDSVEVLVSNAGTYKYLRKALNAVTLPAEHLICSRLIMDLWLLEDWNYEMEV